MTAHFVALGVKADDCDPPHFHIVFAQSELGEDDSDEEFWLPIPFEDLETAVAACQTLGAVVEMIAEAAGTTIFQSEPPSMN